MNKRQAITRHGAIGGLCSDFSRDLEKLVKNSGMFRLDTTASDSVELTTTFSSSRGQTLEILACCYLDCGSLEVTILVTWNQRQSLMFSTTYLANGSFRAIVTLVLMVALDTLPFGYSPEELEDAVSDSVRDLMGSCNCQASFTCLVKDGLSPDTSGRSSSEVRH